MEELLAYYKHRRKTQDLNCPGYVYEYHFWRHQYLDPGMIQMSRRLHQDIRALPLMDMAGMVEDGSNKSFLPNGLQSYTYSRTLTDSDVELDPYFDMSLAAYSYRQVMSKIKPTVNFF